MAQLLCPLHVEREIAQESSSSSPSSSTPTPAPTPTPPTKLRDAPSLSLLLLFLATPKAKEATQSLISIIINGTIHPKTQILSYKSPAHNNSTIEIPASSLSYMKEVDVFANSFIAKVIEKASPHAGCRISFLADKCISRLTSFLHVPTPLQIQPDLHPHLQSTAAQTVSCTRALISLCAYPEMRDDLNHYNPANLLLFHVKVHQPEHMKTVRRVQKRKIGYDHTLSIVKKLKLHLDEVEKEIAKLEAETEYESVERKEVSDRQTATSTTKLN